MRAAPAADYNKNEIRYFVKLMIEDDFSSWLQQPARRFFCVRWMDPGKKGVRKMKIIRQGKTAILLAAALFIGLFAIFPAQSLASESVTDRPSLDSENHNAYLVGYEDGTVRPQKAITRAEVATIFFRLLTEDGRDRYLTTENDFSDVAADAWYNTPVSTLAGAGMLSGYEDGSFRPDAAITRAEFAAMALRFLEEDRLVTDEWRGGFTDVGDAWYTEAVETAEIHAIVSGYPDGSFRPEKAITRAEVCAVINRTLDRSFDVDGCLVVGEMTTWTDNQPDAWYYNDIQEATNDHAYDWTIVDGEIVEVWTEIL